jgi:HD-GYP domain-containing protein (c-di-GMP phosphodiesterase class II)
VVDAFDAMTSDRQYRSRLDVDHARTQLIQGKGTQFDAELVDVFLRVIANYDELQQEMEELHIGTDSYPPPDEYMQDDH